MREASIEDPVRRKSKTTATVRREVLDRVPGVGECLLEEREGLADALASRREARMADGV